MGMLLRSSRALSHGHIFFHGHPFGRVAVRASVTAATTAAPSMKPVAVTFPTSRPLGALDFNDARTAFASKTDAEILRAYVVFKLSSIPLFVKNARTLLALGNKVLGSKLTNSILRMTFFGHFCAGETAVDIYPTIDRLRAAGIGAILDYAAEADVGAVVNADPEKEGVQCRVYDYEGEEQCDANVNIFLSCIETSAARPNGFAAIKVSALGKPELLQRMSTILVSIRNLFTQFETPGARAAVGPRRISLEEFRNGFHKLGLKMSDAKIAELFNDIDYDKNGYIDIIEWLDHLNLQEQNMRIFLAAGMTLNGEALPQLTRDERIKMDNMFKRLEKLAAAAYAKNVRLMIDAEQTYLQPAIDHLALTLQRKYNKNFPTIYNTYQCYLTDAYDRVKMDLQRAKQDKHIFAAKIVRGAYMVQERKRASEMGYPDPVYPTIEDTHENYNRVIDLLVENHDHTDFMVASHNEASIHHTVKRMEELNIPPHSNVFFGQLLGMCDHVSFSLGRHGYSVSKYVPYGPIDEVTPYLLRRAEENSSLMGGAGKERRMLRDELIHRMKRRFGLAAPAAI